LEEAGHRELHFHHFAHHASRKECQERALNPSRNTALLATEKELKSAAGLRR
jgi:hypothetical protein